MTTRDRNQGRDEDVEGKGPASTTGTGYGPAGEVYGGQQAGPGEAGSDGKEWPAVPHDWPRRLGDADEETADEARAAAEAKEREEDDEAVEDSDLGPPAVGTSTQTGRGSTSGRS